ncbi:MAG TPA: flagellar filament capping protein FliD, partial [Anaerolineales bacterium]|nr:flagellar filament capping protein FliD [Anaerolineales bacterium]
MSVNSIGQLDPSFTQLINNLMALERRPLTRLNEEKDRLGVKKAVYQDLRDRLEGLHSLTKGFLKSETTNSLASGRSLQVTAANDKNVVAASVSASAAVGTYDLQVTQLARTHTVRSAQQTYSDQALGLQGSFLLGGLAERQAVRAPEFDGDPVIQAAGVNASLYPGQRELGSGDYFIETRQSSEGDWQFRLVDADGQAVRIRQGDGSDFSDAWQSLPAGETYDTGLGLSLTFGSASEAFVARDRTDPATAVAYSAQGATIAVETGDTLIEIASKINSAKYADGNRVLASVIDRQLVLRGENSGADKWIIAQDTAAGVDNVLQHLGVLQADNQTFAHYDPTRDAPADAHFKINDLEIVRSRNTGLDDVIMGITLNLQPDAAGQSASLSVTANSAESQAAVTTFVSRFNDLQTYLKNKTSVTKEADGTYTRQSLSGESIFRTLRMDLFSHINADAANAGVYRNLSNIGIHLDDDLKLEVKDSARLQAALEANRDDVEDLMDAVMRKMDAQLGRFSGASGYMQLNIDDANDRIEYANSQVQELNTRLDRRQLQLIQQYTTYQN